MKRLFAPWVLAVALVLGLASCTNPYDPGQRAIGGGLIGAGAGAAIGAAAGGGSGAALGAAVGGAVGAVAGAATTPRPPPPPRAAYRRCRYGTHWVVGYRNRWGDWVPSHCSPNW